MIPYTKYPVSLLSIESISIASFIQKNDSNIDWKTVDSFSTEWEKFNNFSAEEIEQIGNDYFDIVPKGLYKNATVLDMGCGSGRWSKYLANKVKFIEAVDPSNAVVTAHKILKENNNVRITQAEVANLPFKDETFDLVISLGVLHHVPDTSGALLNCVSKIKKGGACLIYLYYNLDNRGTLYQIIFAVSNIIRRGISILSSVPKKIICDIIAYTVYWPLAKISGMLKTMGSHSFYKKIPLSYYHDKSINILKNDSLDRFGTPLEQRFSKKEITKMMVSSGLKDIAFSKKAPYWHALGYKRQ